MIEGLRFRFKGAWPFLIPAIFLAVISVLPVLYLIIRAFEADITLLSEILLRPRNLMLLGNTMTLIGGVVIISTLIALPLAWISERSSFKGRTLITTLALLPLAIPGYVLAYTLLGLGGYYGLFNQIFGIPLVHIQGYWGTLIALSLYTFPYLFLNLRSGLAGIDARGEETARSMGCSPWAIFFRVTLPQLRPAFLSGWLVIALYVLGDFGTIALMRFQVLSYALYTQYSGAFDRIYTAWLALMLIALAISFITAEYMALGRGRFSSSGTGVVRSVKRYALTPWQTVLSCLFLFIIFLGTIILPSITLIYWLMLIPETYDYAPVVKALIGSLQIALPTALWTTTLVLPVVYLAVRYKSTLSHLLERTVMVGYAIPSLALGLAFVFFSLGVAPFLYQTLFVLMLAYGVHFGVLAMGTLRTALLQMSPRYEEGSKALGRTSVQTFMRITLPLLKRGFLASFVMVFLMVMKELPLALILSPTGFSTLALGLFSRTNEGMLADAAPYAVAIIVCSAVFVCILLRSLSGKEKQNHV